MLEETLIVVIMSACQTATRNIGTLAFMRWQYTIFQQKLTSSTIIEEVKVLNAIKQKNDNSFRSESPGVNATENNLIYIGHSMGTTMNFVLLSEKPEYNEKIKLFVALAPVAYMTHVKSPIRFLAPFSKDIEVNS